MIPNIINSFQELLAKTQFDPTDPDNVSGYLEDYLLSNANTKESYLYLSSTPKISNKRGIIHLKEEDLESDFFDELQREVKKTTCDKNSTEFTSEQRRSIADVVNYLQNEIGTSLQKKGQCLYRFLDNHDAIGYKVKKFITESIYKATGKIREKNNIQGKLPHPNDYSRSNKCFGLL